MFAQDTGGAIRGSVRADCFWGFGDSAGRMALATNETMQMWLLLPAQQPISAVAAKGMRLRGDKAELPDCVIADEELCVESRGRNRPANVAGPGRGQVRLYGLDRSTALPAPPPSPVFPPPTASPAFPPPQRG